MDGALFTITGLTARVLKLIVGTPFLVVCAVAILVWRGDPTAVENVLVLVAGVVSGLLGVLIYLSAIQNDEVAIERSSNPDGG